jgi:prophage regulatory protein
MSTSVPQNNCSSPTPLLRLPTVLALTGLSRSTLFALCQHDNFPKPIKISARCSAWLSNEIDAWIAARISANRGPANAAVGERP